VLFSAVFQFPVAAAAHMDAPLSSYRRERKQRTKYPDNQREAAVAAREHPPGPLLQGLVVLSADGRRDSRPVESFCGEMIRTILSVDILVTFSETIINSIYDIESGIP